MEQGRFIGLDLGRRRVGVAVSDPGGLIARPLDTLIVKGGTDTLKQVLDLVAEYDPAGIVLGRPLGLSGGSSEMLVEVEKFAERLRGACSVPVYFEDERLSSRQAEAILHAHGKKIKGNKPKIDRMAAAIILQSFLDRRNMGRGERS